MVHQKIGEKTVYIYRRLLGLQAYMVSVWSGGLTGGEGYVFLSVADLAAMARDVW